MPITRLNETAAQRKMFGRGRVPLSAAGASILAALPVTASAGVYS